MALEFRCADAGLACKAAVKADTKDELLEQVGAHARDAHGVELNQTLVDYALTRVRETSSSS